jgi:hypothetical protein
MKRSWHANWTAQMVYRLVLAGLTVGTALLLAGPVPASARDAELEQLEAAALCQAMPYRCAAPQGAPRVQQSDPVKPSKTRQPRPQPAAPPEASTRFCTALAGLVESQAQARDQGFSMTFTAMMTQEALQATGNPLRVQQLALDILPSVYRTPWLPAALLRQGVLELCLKQGTMPPTERY